MTRPHKSTLSLCVGAAAMLLIPARVLPGQTCTTQSRMQPAVRQALADAALDLATQIKAANTPAVKTSTIADLAGNFAGTESLVRSTALKLNGDTLRVTQVYDLDATGRKIGDAGSADFSCPLAGTNGETDFSINGLPPGDYGFAMVEAAGGARPWLLALLLQKESGAWKMAGFYPKARTLAGRDGGWYWTAARDAKQSFLAWLYYTQALELLQPAPFLDSTNLDKLRTEQRTVTPREAINGVSVDSPLVVKGTGAVEYKITAVSLEAAQDDHGLHLVLHVADTAGDPDAIRGRGEGAARALVLQHPELKLAFSAVNVLTETPQGASPVVSVSMGQIQ